MPINYIASEYQLTSIANSIRERSGTTDDLVFPEGFINTVKNIKGIPISVHVNPETGRWQRPAEYPDLDAIDLGDNVNIVYMTYDLRKTPDYGWIGLHATTSSGGWYVERGHLENNVFVSDESHTMSSNNYFRQALDSANGDVQLWRVTTTVTTGRITSLGFATSSDTTSLSLHNQLQPCVERRGFLDYAYPTVGDSGTGTSYRKHCTMWMERDALVMARQYKVTDLRNIWLNAYSLQELDLTQWDVSMWRVTRMSSMFNLCCSLQTLDFTGWDMNDWAITTIASMFYYFLAPCSI